METEEIAELIAVAAKVFENAYAPYSNYCVGAALLDADGEIYTGCNVENASYGLAMCAERTACFNAVSSGSRKYKAIAIVAESDSLPMPCGACRQVLAEFCGPEFPVYIASARAPNDYKQYSLGELLPHAFAF